MESVLMVIAGVFLTVAALAWWLAWRQPPGPPPSDELEALTDEIQERAW